MDLEWISTGNSERSFSIRLLGRERSAWQGSPAWTDQNRTGRFRSALETLQRVEAALDEVPGV